MLETCVSVRTTKCGSPFFTSPAASSLVSIQPLWNLDIYLVDRHWDALYLMGFSVITPGLVTYICAASKAAFTSNGSLERQHLVAECWSVWQAATSIPLGIGLDRSKISVGVGGRKLCCSSMIAPLPDSKSITQIGIRTVKGTCLAFREAAIKMEPSNSRGTSLFLPQLYTSPLWRLPRHLNSNRGDQGTGGI